MADTAAASQTVTLGREDPRVLAYCLRWHLFEPLTSIRVLDDPANGQSQLRPLFQADAAHSEAGATLSHPAASLPLTDPPVKSLDVFVQNMDDAYELFMDLHHRSMGEQDYIPEGGVECAPCTCGCGFTPPPMSTLTVRASLDSPHITLADFVKQIHEWLLTLEDVILRVTAEGGYLDGTERKPAGTRYIVQPLDNTFNRVLLVELEDEHTLDSNSASRAQAAANHIAQNRNPAAVPRPDFFAVAAILNAMGGPEGQLPDASQLRAAGLMNTSAPRLADGAALGGPAPVPAMLEGPVVGQPLQEAALSPAMQFQRPTWRSQLGSDDEEYGDDDDSRGRD